MRAPDRREGERAAVRRAIGFAWLCHEINKWKNVLERCEWKIAVFGAFLSILANFFVGKRLTSRGLCVIMELMKIFIFSLWERKRRKNDLLER